MSFPRVLSAVVLVLLFGTGATCLGPATQTPGGDWVGVCALDENVDFSLDGLIRVAEGEDILLEATGTWTLYQGGATWGPENGAVDLAQCTDEGACTLQGTIYRVDTVIVLFYTSSEPALLGAFDPETGEITGDCFEGNSAGEFTATRPQR